LRDLSPVYGTSPPKKGFLRGGLTSVPRGAHLIATDVKRQYENIPFHVYYPGPHDAITILQSKKSPHDWLVCGWYLDTYREGNVVKGLLYRQVVAEPDKEAIAVELKKHDKEASARFGL